MCMSLRMSYYLIFALVLVSVVYGSNFCDHSEKKNSFLAYLCKIQATSGKHESNRNWKNVALKENGASCKASAEYSRFYKCEKAIDGSLLKDGGDWATRRGGKGSWIKIQFDDTYYLTYTRIMQRFFKHEQFDLIQLTFSDGTTLKKRLHQNNGNGLDIYKGQYWDEWELSKSTSYVTITSLSEYKQRWNPGFVEIEFYTGSYPCSVNFTSVNGKCFHYNTTSVTEWTGQVMYCQSLGANLAGIDSVTHLYDVVSWLSKSYGGRDGFWVSSDMIPEGILPAVEVDVPLSETDIKDMGLALVKPGFKLKAVKKTMKMMALCEKYPASVIS